MPSTYSAEQLAQTLIERAFPLWCDPSRTSMRTRDAALFAARRAIADNADAVAYADACDVLDAIESDAESLFQALVARSTGGAS